MRKRKDPPVWEDTRVSPSSNSVANERGFSTHKGRQRLRYCSAERPLQRASDV